MPMACSRRSPPRSLERSPNWCWRAADGRGPLDGRICLVQVAALAQSGFRFAVLTRRTAAHQRNRRSRCVAFTLRFARLLSHIRCRYVRGAFALLWICCKMLISYHFRHRATSLTPAWTAGFGQKRGRVGPFLPTRISYKPGREPRFVVRELIVAAVITGTSCSLTRTQIVFIRGECLFSLWRFCTYHSKPSVWNSKVSFPC
jgi:hypothetical protein